MLHSQKSARIKPAPARKDKDFLKDTKRLTRGRAIRAKCIDCMCGQLAEVRFCPSHDCPLYPFRMGREVKDVPLPSDKATN